MDLSTWTLALASFALLCALVGPFVVLHVVRGVARRVDEVDPDLIELRVTRLVGEYQSTLVDLEAAMSDTLQKARAQYARLRKAQKAQEPETPSGEGDRSPNGSEPPEEALAATKRAQAYADAQRAGLWP